MGAGAYDLLGVSSPSAAVTLGDTLYMYYTAIRYRAPDMAPAELACADLTFVDAFVPAVSSIVLNPSGGFASIAPACAGSKA